LRGSDFDASDILGVLFDSAAASNVQVVNSSNITAVTPPHAAGPVTVSITTRDGPPVQLAAAFTYVAGAPPGPDPPGPGDVTLRVIVQGGGDGRIISDLPGIACGDDCVQPYTFGTAVQLVAVPGPASTQANWGGDPDCSDGAVTLTTDITCHARFEPLSDARAIDLDGDSRGDLVGVAPTTTAGPSAGLHAVIAHDGIVRAGSFNADGISDFFGYDPLTGRWSLVVTGVGTLEGLAPAKQSVLLMDVNGDRVDEVVFHDLATGRLEPCAGGASELLECLAPSTTMSGALALPTDVDGDGRGDLVVYRMTTGEVSFVRGAAEGTFSPGAVALTVPANRQLLTADFTGDGRFDLLFMDTEGGAVTLYVNDTTAFLPIELGHVVGFAIRAAALDGDDRADLLAYDAGTGQTIQALNTGAGFTLFSTTLPARRRLSLSDLNGDGRTDVVLYDPVTGALTRATSDHAGFTVEEGVVPPGLWLLTQRWSLRFGR
jgi:hypothetical protein